MNNYNFELANNSYAQKVMKLAGASGACLFLFNTRFDDERAISFLHHTRLHSEAIDLYRKGLFKYDTFLPVPNDVKFDRVPYLNTKRKRTYRSADICEKSARHNRKYWQTLGGFGYEETGAMVQKISRKAFLVIGIHLEDHRHSLQFDKTISTLESWMSEAGEYVVESSVQQFQNEIDKRVPAYDFNSGARKLTNRERQVVCEVLKGKSNKQIATTLLLSDYTVENHLRRIYRKFDVHNRTSLAATLTAQKFSA